jgi:hypothetical protein
VLFVSQLLYATAVALTKCSIIACYLRVFPNVYARRVVIAVGCIVIATWICSIFVAIFACTPVQAIWDFTITDKQCISLVPFFYFSTSLNGITDLVLCLIPIPLLFKIQVTTKERAILIVLFGLGFFASAASFIRLSHLHELYDPDITYAITNSLDWSVIEIGVGIICASVPSLRPLMGKISKEFHNYSTPEKSSRKSGARLSIANNFEVSQ